MENEKDCADQYLECSSECDINDSECEEECVTDLKECDVPEPTKWVENDGSTGECPPAPGYNWREDEGELISEILQIAALLRGTATRSECLTSQGISSKKITIEYDVKHKDEVGTD
tara:strand:+ start:3725 stop:4072 length:348 start_codon:yes stop_codon:yes gene_type:complete